MDAHRERTREEPAASPAPQRRPRLEALDGLRGVSILIVLLGHGAHTDGAPDWVQPLREMGIVGVELFFVISGFIITRLLLRERQRRGAVDLRGFWLRRALRLGPPLLACFAGIATASACGVLHWSWTSMLGGLTLTKNFNLFPGDWFFGHLWSLSLEEQFYVVWPLVFAAVAVPRRALPWLFGCVALGVWLTPATFEDAKPLQNLLPYVPYLAAGCTLAIAMDLPGFPPLQRYARLPRRGAACAAAVAAATVISWLRHENRALNDTIALDALLMPLAGALLVYEAAAADGRLKATLGRRPIVALGTVSYSVYLWQQLYLGPGQVYEHPWLLGTWPFNLIAAVLSGSLAWWLIERPLIGLRARLSARHYDSLRESRAAPRTMVKR